VFERLKFSSTVSASNNSGNGAIAKSYAQVVNDTNFPSSNNGPIYREKSNRNVGINSLKRKSPTMPGLLPFMKYSTFKSPDCSHWPNDSFRNWFQARGPILEAVMALSFRELAAALSPLPFQSAPSFPPCTVNPSSPVPPQSPLTQAPKQAEMANVPINPEPFVHNGFKIVHMECRTTVHRVVLPRWGRKHEDFAITTITPMPQGQVHFANVRDVPIKFLNTEARVGFKSVQKCPFGQAYIQLDHLRDRDMLVNISPHVFGDISISFAKHNEGINWRRTHLNRE
jgi:hypothetical protein